MDFKVRSSEALPLSLLNDFLYCPRRAALKAVEGWRGANEHTARGDIVHERADLPGYEVAKGVTVLRALPVWSDRLGLSGKCDVVEAQSLKSKVQSLDSEEQSAECRQNAGLEPEPSHVGACASLVPVEYKKGRQRAFENDDAQLCAQALCLEEMFRRAGGARGGVSRGEQAAAGSGVHGGVAQVDGGCGWRIASAGGRIPDSDLRFQMPALPPAVFKPACEECSLYEICLPQLTGAPGGVARAAQRLFEI